MDSPSFMFAFGLTCLVREQIEQSGLDRHHMRAALDQHEKHCQECHAAYEELYASGMLNGERPAFLKRGTRK